MVHSKIFGVFKEKFSHFYQYVEAWFPNGKDSVRVRLRDKQEVIFTYHGEQNWMLESRNSFLNRMKGAM